MKLGFASCLMLIGIYVAIIAVLALLFQIAYFHLINDIFVGFVEHGLMPTSLTYWQSFKLLFIGGLIGTPFALKS